MTEVAVSTLSEAEARSLTDEVKHDSERLWRKLVELYDGGAHRALGYSSWGAYFKTEFGQSGSHGYRLLDAGRALEIVSHSPIGERPNEAQARELAPLLDQPETMLEAWNEASSNGTPTAVAVRESVERRLPPVSEEARAKQRRWAATMNVLDGLSHFDRPAITEQAHAEAELIDPEAAASRGQAVTPERLRNASAWAGLLADALERRSA